MLNMKHGGLDAMRNLVPPGAIPCQHAFGQDSVPRRCPVTFSDHISHYTTEPYSHLLILLAEETQGFSGLSAVQGEDSMNWMDCLICPSIVLTPLIGQNKMKKTEWLRKTELKTRNCFLIKLMCHIHLPLCEGGNCRQLPSKRQSAISICPSTPHLQKLIRLRWGPQSGHLPLASSISPPLCITQLLLYNNL